MKYSIIILSAAFLVSCSTVNRFEERASKQDKMIEHLSQEDKMIGAELPVWTEAEGINGQFVYAVGEAESSANQSPDLIKKTAAHDAKMKIVQRLPTEYKHLVQRSISNASDNEFNQIEIAKGDLYGMQGVKTSRKYSTCRKVIRHTDFGSKVNRICYVQASVSIKNLNDAIVRTVKRKYGEDTGNKFKEILKKQVEQELTQQSNQEQVSFKQQNVAKE